MNQHGCVELHLRRGDDGKLHWVGVMFSGLEEETAKSIFKTLVRRARRNGWKIEVGKFVRHENAPSTKTLLDGKRQIRIGEQLMPSKRLKGRVTYGLTLNLGNGQSAMLQFSFEFDLGDYEPDQAFSFAREVVDAQALEVRGIPKGGR